MAPPIGDGGLGQERNDERARRSLWEASLLVPRHRPQTPPGEEGPQGPDIQGVPRRTHDYPLDDEYGHIPEEGPALTPVRPRDDTPEKMDEGGDVVEPTADDDAPVPIEEPALSPTGGTASVPDDTDAGKRPAPAPTLSGAQLALVKAIYGGEAPGYNTRFDGSATGTTFDDYADHPRKLETITFGPYKGQKSDAAGAPQFISTTWDTIKKQIGATDFSPPWQDAGTWELARQTYASKFPKRDLLSDLQSGQISNIAPALAAHWQSAAVKPDEFNKRLRDALNPPVAAAQASGGSVRTRLAEGGEPDEPTTAEPPKETSALPPPPPGFGEVKPIEAAPSALPPPPPGFGPVKSVAAPVPQWTQAKPYELKPAKTQEEVNTQIEALPGGAHYKTPEGKVFQRPKAQESVDPATGEKISYAYPGDQEIKPPGWLGVGLEATKKGLVSGFTHAAQAPTAFRDRPAEEPDTSPVGQLLAQPITEGYSDPKWYIAHIANAAAESSPAFALAALGTLGGGAVGSAFPVVGTGVGGMLGGAGGFAIGSAMGTIAPAYQRARADNLDHDAAVDRAIKESGIAAAFGAAMGVVPALGLFGRTAEGALKRPISEALAQIFGVQPAIGAGQQAATGAVEGKMPTAPEFATGYVENVGLGGTMVAGHAAARRLLGHGEAAPPATLSPESQAAVDQARAVGATVTVNGQPQTVVPVVGETVGIPMGEAGVQPMTVARATPEGDIVLTDAEGIEHRMTAEDVARLRTEVPGAETQPTAEQPPVADEIAANMLQTLRLTNNAEQAQAVFDEAVRQYGLDDAAQQEVAAAFDRYRAEDAAGAAVPAEPTLAPAITPDASFAPDEAQGRTLEDMEREFAEQHAQQPAELNAAAERQKLLDMAGVGGRPPQPAAPGEITAEFQRDIAADQAEAARTTPPPIAPGIAPGIAPPITPPPNMPALPPGYTLQPTENGRLLLTRPNGSWIAEGGADAQSLASLADHAGRDAELQAAKPTPPQEIPPAPIAEAVPHGTEPAAPALTPAVRVGGQIYTGATHGEAYAEALRANGGIDPGGPPSDRNLFVTQDGNILSHSEAVASTAPAAPTPPEVRVPEEPRPAAALEPTPAETASISQTPDETAVAPPIAPIPETVNESLTPAPEQIPNAPVVTDEKHTKTGSDIFAVRFPQKPDIEGLGAQAKKLGGYWSSFRGGGMRQGWMFKTREGADRFAEWARERLAPVEPGERGAEIPSGAQETPPPRPRAPVDDWADEIVRAYREASEAGGPLSGAEAAIAERDRIIAEKKASVGVSAVLGDRLRKLFTPEEAAAIRSWQQGQPGRFTPPVEAPAATSETPPAETPKRAPIDDWAAELLKTFREYGTDTARDAYQDMVKKRRLSTKTANLLRDKFQALMDPEEIEAIKAGREPPPRPVEAPQPAPAVSGWTEIGKNYIGQTLFEDQNGARSIVENGVRSTEPVEMVPARGGTQIRVRSPAYKDAEYQVAEPHPSQPERKAEYQPPAEPSDAQRIGEQVVAARDATEEEPTDAQKEAGNYPKGRVNYHGLPFVMENPEGSTRRGVDGAGQPWESTLPADYGYVSRTEGADGEHVDAYLGPDLESKQAFVVDQFHPEDGFDEHKVLLGFNNWPKARQAYLDAFSDGSGEQRLGNVTPMSIDELKTWLKEGDTKNPVGQAELPLQPQAVEPTLPSRPGEETPGGIQNALHPGDEGAGSEAVHGATEVGTTRPARRPEADRGERPAEAVAGERPAPEPSEGTRGGGDRAGDADRVPAAGERPAGEPGTAGRPETEPPVEHAPDAEVRGTNFSLSPGVLQESRSPRIKARDNLVAIELAKRLIDLDRPATREEQAQLAKYVGWGGLSGAFPDSRGNLRKGFEDIDARLKEILTPKEYEAAARSTQYAHYTSEPVIRSMWNAMERMGFKGGSVFEPGMGVGHFLGFMPGDLAANSRYHGIEIDPMTAHIAKLLYPESGVRQGDFIRTPLPDGAFDVAIGNPPFADITVRGDPKYAARGFLLHDYFFAKSLDSVRPGGLLGFVTSAGTMNKLDDAARNYLAQRAEFVGGVRLPSTAFAKSAGTEVTTDILFFKKRPSLLDLEGQTPDWAQTVVRDLPGPTGETMQGNVSRYFSEHPEQVLGEEGFFDKLYKGRYAVHETPGTEIESRLAEAMNRLPENVMDAPLSPEAKAALDFSTSEKKDGSFYLQNGQLMQYSGGAGRPVQTRGKEGGGFTAQETQTIRHLLPIRDSLRDVYRADLAENMPEGAEARERLNKAYDKFVAEHGPINKLEVSYRRPTIIQQETARAEAREEARELGHEFQEGDFDAGPLIARGMKSGEIARLRQAAHNRASEAGREFDEGTFDPADMPDLAIEKRPNIDAFMDDPESYRLRAIENYDEKTGDASKRRIFNESVLTREQEPEVRSAADGVLWALNKYGKLDLDEIAKKLGTDREKVIADLGDGIYRIPGTRDTFLPQDAYLSGDVVSKLEESRAAAERDPEMRRNVEALEKVQPPPLSPADISVRLGMPWVPVDFVRDFMNERLRIGDTSIDYNPHLGQWVVDSRGARYGEGQAEWATQRMPAHEIMAAALNRTSPKIYDTFREAGSTKRELNVEATQAAQDKVDAMREAFADWIGSDPAKGDEIARIYNGQYNRVVLRKWDGSYLTTPGVAKDWSWRPHQTRGMARVIQDGNAYIAHAVGSGKTSLAVGAAMEMRRLGLVNKPMVVVPNHMLGQFAKEWYEQYPTARLMVADERRFHTDRRKQFVADVAQQDLDGVIITNSAFKKIGISKEYEADLIREEVEKLDESMRALGQDPDDLERISRDAQDNRITVKKLQNKKQKLEERLSGHGATDVDQTNTFEELGVDFLFVDEAHCFPHEALVVTDHGPLKIGDIVERRLPVRVASYDHASGHIVWRRVHNYWRHDRAQKAIVAIRTESGEVKCTANHQVFVEGRGYVRADSINAGDTLLALQGYLHQACRRPATEVLLTKLRMEMAVGSEAADNQDLRMLPDDLFIPRQGAGQQREAPVLWEALSDGRGHGRPRPEEEGYFGCALRCEGTHEIGSRASGQFSAYARAQSYAVAGGAGEDARQLVGAYLPGSRRQWENHNSASAPARIDRAFDGACDPNGSCERTIRELATLLQGRLGRPCAEVGDRDRWQDTQTESLEIPRCEEDSRAGRARVVSVEILERGSERERRCCGGEDRYVYDLGIEGEHNYFADGHLVHNSFRKLAFASQQNLKGISPEGSDMAWDLYAKSRYLDSRNPGRSLVLMSGTPVTNTMGELYTVSRYLQRPELEKQGLGHFDSWAQTFGDTKTELEQTAQGTYDQVTRFASLNNVPELYKMVGQVMDVVTPNELSQYVTRPELKGGERQFHLAPRTPFLEAFQRDLAGRVEAIKARKGPPSKGDDILLSVINDGRLAAIDPRLARPDAENDPSSKLNEMIDNAHRIWRDTANQPFYDPATREETFRGPAVQLIFSNLGIVGREREGQPRGFSAYQWMKRELQRRGVPGDEIAFIKDYPTPLLKQRLFNDINEGKVRILIGSTQKMGTGLNVQRRLYAVHNLDPLWLPADDEQRVGRILRQGNLNPEIEVHDYSTKGTYDSTMWQMMGRKGRFIEQFFRGDPTLRNMEDLGEASMYEQAAAMATSDERVIQLTQMRQDLKKLERQEAAHSTEQFGLRWQAKAHNEEVAGLDKSIARAQGDIAQRKDTTGDKFTMKVGNRNYPKRADAAAALDKAIDANFKDMQKGSDRQIGQIGGFPLMLRRNTADQSSVMLQRSDGSRGNYLGGRELSGASVIREAERDLRGLEGDIEFYQSRQEAVRQRAAAAESQIGKVFPDTDKIPPLREQIAALEAELARKEEAQAPEAPANKFPPITDVPAEQDIPSREIYDAAMANNEETLRTKKVGPIEHEVRRNWLDMDMHEKRNDAALRDGLISSDEHEARKAEIEEEKKARGLDKSYIDTINKERRKLERENPDRGLAQRGELPEGYEDRLEDYRTFAGDRSDAHASARDYVVDRGKETGNEYTAAIDPRTGRVEFALTSNDPDGTRFSPELVSVLESPDGKVTVHHYHPGDGGFSGVDIGSLAFPGMDTLIAHGPSGDFFSARLTPEMRAALPAENPDTALRNLYARAAGPIADQMRRLRDNGVISNEDGERLYADVIGRALNAAGVIEYGSSRPLAPIPDAITKNMIRRAATAVSEAAGLKGDIDAGVNRSTDTVQFDRAMGEIPDEHAAELAPGRSGGERNDPAGRAGVGEPPEGRGLAEDTPEDAARAESAIAVEPTGEDAKIAERIRGAGDGGGSEPPPPPPGGPPAGEPPTEPERRKADLNKIMFTDNRSLLERMRETIKQFKENGLLRSKQYWFDTMASLEKQERAIHGGELAAGRLSPTISMRMAKNWRSTLDVALTESQVRYNPDTGVVEPIEGSKPWKEITRQLTEDQRETGRPTTDDFALWYIVRRAERLMGEGREHNVPQEMIDKYRNLDELYQRPDGTNLFHEVDAEMQEWHKNLLDFGEATGIVNHDSRQLWEHNDYIPFYRAMEDEKVAGPTSGAGRGIMRSPIRELKGGEQKINNIYENSVLNAAAMIRRGMENAARQKTRTDLLFNTDALVPMSKDARAVYGDPVVQAGLRAAGLDPMKLTEDAKQGARDLFGAMKKQDPDVWSVMDKGRPNYYQVRDPLLLQSLLGAGPQTISGIQSILTAPARLLRGAVVFDPAFMLAHNLRMAQHAYILTGANPIASMGEALRQAKGIDPVALRLMAAGAMSGRYDINLPRKIRDEISSPEYQNSLINTPLKAARFIRNISEKAMHASDIGPRIAVYKDAIKRGASEAEAIDQARDLLDFSTHGAGGAATFLAQTIPFLNARWQGMARSYRGFVGEDRNAILMRGALVAAATIALWYQNKDDPEYQRKEDWDRQYAWQFKVGDSWFRLPKPFELGALFGALPEILMEYGNNGSTRELGNATGALFSSVFKFNPIPVAIRPALEAWWNHDTFTGQPIINEREKALEPDLQYGPNDSASVVALTQAYNSVSPAPVAPAVVQHLLQGYLAGWGTYITTAADYLGRQVGALPSHASPTQMPVVGRFLTSEPEAGNRIQSDFYALKQQIIAVGATVREAEKTEDHALAQRLLKAHPEYSPALEKGMNKIGADLSKIRGVYQRAQMNANLTAEQKTDARTQYFRQRDQMLDTLKPLLRQAEGLTARP